VLWLDNTSVTGVGLINVKPLVNLVELDLSDCKQIASGLEALHGLTKLQRLKLNGMALPQKELDALYAALPKCEITYSPDPLVKALSENQNDLPKALAAIAEVEVNDKGEIIAVNFEGTLITNAALEPLRSHKTLRKLDLSRCNVTDAGIEHLATISSLRYLNLSTTAISDKALASIGAMTALEDLFLNDTLVSDHGLEQLRRLSKLRRLGLSGTQITDASLKLVTHWKELDALDLTKTAITNGGLIELQAVPYLQSLALRDTQVSDAGLERLTKHGQLETLWLEHTRVTKNGIRLLQDALPKCRIYAQ
jgi:hypothetical protein